MIAERDFLILMHAVDMLLADIKRHQRQSEEGKDDMPDPGVASEHEEKQNRLKKLVEVSPRD